MDPDLDKTVALVSGSPSPLVSCDAGGGGGGDRRGGGGGGGGRSTHGLGDRRPLVARSVIPGRFFRCFFGMKQRGIFRSCVSRSEIYKNKRTAHTQTRELCLTVLFLAQIFVFVFNEKKEKETEFFFSVCFARGKT